MTYPPPKPPPPPPPEPEPERKHFWQEWGELDAGAKVLVLAAFGFGIWLIYMFASAA